MREQAEARSGEPARGDVSVAPYLIASAAIFLARVALGMQNMQAATAGSRIRIAGMIAIQFVHWVVIGLTATWVVRKEWPGRFYWLWGIAALLLWQLALPIFVARKRGLAKGGMALVLVLLFSILITILSVLTVLPQG